MRQYLLATFRDKNHEFLRQVLPVEGECVLRFNAASTARLVVRDTHPVVPLLTTDGLEGIRAAVWLIRIDGSALLRHKLLEGQVGDLEGEGPLGTVTIPIIDDWEWFTQVLARPVGSAEFAHYSGPSDARAITALAAVKARLSLPWNIPATESLGTVGVTDLVREPVSAVAEALTLDRIQLTLTRVEGPDGTGNAWDVSLGRGSVYPRPLTPESGVLGAWRWVRQRTRATRMTVGGAEAAGVREFTDVVDAPREAAVGRVMEGFVDASGAEVGDDLTPYGRDALAEQAIKAGVTATLRESSWFRFPEKYNIGTQVTVQAGAMSVDDVITEIRVTQNRDGSLPIVPKVGLADADPQTKLTKAVAALAASVRRSERR